MKTSSKTLSEFEATQKVHEALETFDPPARSRILRAVTSLLEVAGGHFNSDVKQDPIVNPNATGTILPQTRIDSFVTAKRPSTTYQRLACLAYYLEHHDQKSDLTGKELIKANSDARQQKISNMSVFLGDATSKYGFFAPVGGGKKRLASRGAALVEALPDQTAVKKILQEFPLPKRSGRKAKSKSNK